MCNKQLGIVLFSIFALALSAAPVQAQATVTNESIPLFIENTCNGDLISFVAHLHSVTNIVSNGNANHININQHWHGTGTGSISGATYQFNWNVNDVLNVSSNSGTINVISREHLIGQGPVNNQIIDITFLVTFANGEIRTFIESTETVCH